MSANVGSLGSSAASKPGLAGVGTANAVDVDATPLRARKWEIVRVASPQPDKTSWLKQIFATRHNDNKQSSFSAGSAGFSQKMPPDCHPIMRRPSLPRTSPRTEDENGPGASGDPAEAALLASGWGTADWKVNAPPWPSATCEAECRWLTEEQRTVPLYERVEALTWVGRASTRDHQHARACQWMP